MSKQILNELDQQLSPLKEFGLKFKVYEDENGYQFSFTIPENFDFDENKSIQLRKVNLLNFMMIYYEDLFADFCHASVDKLINEAFYKTDMNAVDDRGNNAMINEIMYMSEIDNGLAKEQYEYMLKKTNLYHKNHAGKSYFDILIEKNNALDSLEVDFLLTQNLNKEFAGSTDTLADVMAKVPMLLEELTTVQELLFVKNLSNKNYNLIKHFMLNAKNPETQDFLIKNTDFTLMNKEGNILLVDLIENGLSDGAVNRILKSKKINPKRKNDTGNLIDNLDKSKAKISYENYELLSNYFPENAKVLTDQIKDIGFFKKFMLMIKAMLNKNKEGLVIDESVNYLSDLSYIKSYALKEKVTSIVELFDYFALPEVKEKIVGEYSIEVKNLNDKTQKLLKEYKTHNSAEIEKEVAKALENVQNSLQDIKEYVIGAAKTNINVMKRSM